MFSIYQYIRIQYSVFIHVLVCGSVVLLYFKMPVKFAVLPHFLKYCFRIKVE